MRRLGPLRPGQLQGRQGQASRRAIRAGPVTRPSGPGQSQGHQGQASHKAIRARPVTRPSGPGQSQGHQGQASHRARPVTGPLGPGQSQGHQGQASHRSRPDNQKAYKWPEVFIMVMFTRYTLCEPLVMAMVNEGLPSRSLISSYCVNDGQFAWLP